MFPHKGPQIIRYCVITSTVALVSIAVSMLPINKVNKLKLLCAEYWSNTYTEQKQRKLANAIGTRTENLREYCDYL